jgi:hypothetical protein
MNKMRLFSLSAILLVTTSLAPTSLTASTSVEVLYVATPQTSNASLVTYNVDPATAVAIQAGSAVTVGATNIDPLTVGTRHVIYVWDANNVWLYLTNAQGVPQSRPAQHLKFNFPHPVTTFLADPDGKFAYAGMIWVSQNPYNNYAAVVLFTIDPSTGKLTNTGTTVATYGPDPYTGLTGFLFGLSGKRLYASYFDNGPFTCIPGYDYYTVNQQTGHLGPLTGLLSANGSCSGPTSIALTDQLTSYSSSCCGQGSGYLSVHRIGTNQTINCGPQNVTFCGDEVGHLNLDPASQNVFFGDLDTGLTELGHLNFTTSQILATGSTIAGNPQLYFSPDSRLVYASNTSDIGIYALQSSTGTLGANTTLPDAANAGIATTTLH